MNVIEFCVMLFREMLQLFTMAGKESFQSSSQFLSLFMFSNVAKGMCGFLSKGQGRAREDSCFLLRLGGIVTSISRRIFHGSYNKRRRRG